MAGPVQHEDSTVSDVFDHKLEALFCSAKLLHGVFVPDGFIRKLIRNHPELCRRWQRQHLRQDAP